MKQIVRLKKVNLKSTCCTLYQQKDVSVFIKMMYKYGQEEIQFWETMWIF